MEFGVCKRTMSSLNAFEGHMQIAYVLENIRI